MSDLISREALLAEIQLAIEDSGCVNHERDILDCIRYADTIDAVPVVRCKDCQWSKDHDIWMLLCAAMFNDHGEMICISESDYCAWGSPREKRMDGKERG